MLPLLPVFLYTLTLTLQALFSVGPVPSASQQKQNNLSQSLINELLGTWLVESINIYDKDETTTQISDTKIITERYSKNKFSNKSLLETSNQLTVNSINDKIHKSEDDSLNIEKSNRNDLRKGIMSDDPSNAAGEPRQNEDTAKKNGSVSAKEDALDLQKHADIFRMPAVAVEADWTVVLGSFKHFDDQNWENFLIQSEVPLFIRRLLGWSSETLHIAREGAVEPNSKPSEFQLLVTTSNWLITHQSRAHLRTPYHEDDLDGTESQNTFFFLTPRTLVQEKLKPNWHMFLYRQFDETGCNMTVVDRERRLAARRFYKRLEL